MRPDLHFMTSYLTSAEIRNRGWTENGTAQRKNLRFQYSLSETQERRGDTVAEYMENPDTVIQNLEDAGCDQKTVEQFMKLGVTGDREKQLRLLEQHRRSLLDKVHKNEKQIDCLDYLVFRMRKEKQEK